MAKRESELKEISGLRFEAFPLPFGEGRPALLRLARIVGPAIESKSVSKIVECLSEEDVEYFTRLFARYSYVFIGDRKPLVRDALEEVFADEYGRFVGWLAFCIRYHFSRFFEEAAGLLSVPAAKTGPSA